MDLNYVVTCQKATAVTAAFTARFTSAEATNLVVVKGNHVEVHECTADGLSLLLDVPIYGDIADVRTVRPPGEARDLLLVLTDDRFQGALLAYDAETGTVATRARLVLEE